MSTKQTEGYKVVVLDGDVSVNRNLAMGGALTVQGDAHMKSDLKIDGWLDAKNIKEANKGLFASEQKLKEYYPEPLMGWWAVVGDSLPGKIYMVEDGEWYDTGTLGGGDGEVDLASIRETINNEINRSTVKDAELDAMDVELLKRIQGISENSNSRFDPFKLLGESYANKDKGYDSYEAFNSALDSLLYDTSVTGYNSGYFRARVLWRDVEIQNIVLSNHASNMIIVQIVKGAIKADSTNKNITKDDSGDYAILYRQYKDSAWGEWKEAYQDKLVSGTNIKTINGKSILGSGNITISGGGGEVSPELEAQVTENTANIAQNTSDIEKLMKKNFPLTVSFSVSPSGLQEYGTTVDTVTANWSIDGADVEVLSIELRLDSESWIDVTGKTSHQFTKAGITKDTTVYFGADISGEDYINKQASINFAYAAYMGVVAADWVVSETNIKSLTKQSLSTSRSRNYTTSSALNLQKIVYAYAQDYVAISKVLDGNGFDVTDSFEQKTTTINGVPYYVYVSKEATTTNAKVTVKFS